MAETARSLRGLLLSAAELRQEHPDWSSAMIEDYLNIFENLVTISDELDTKGSFENVTVRVDSDYTVSSTDQEIFANTTSQSISISLPSGVAGRKLRIHNTGESGNNVTLVPDGTDLLFGSNESEILYDTEVVIITFETVEGWD